MPTSRKNYAINVTKEIRPLLHELNGKEFMKDKFGRVRIAGLRRGTHTEICRFGNLAVWHRIGHMSHAGRVYIPLMYFLVRLDKNVIDRVLFERQADKFTSKPMKRKLVELCKELGGDNALSI